MNYTWPFITIMHIFIEFKVHPVISISASYTSNFVDLINSNLVFIVSFTFLPICRPLKISLSRFFFLISSITIFPLFHYNPSFQVRNTVWTISLRQHCPSLFNPGTMECDSAISIPGKALPKRSSTLLSCLLLWSKNSFEIKGTSARDIVQTMVFS